MADLDEIVRRKEEALERRDQANRELEEIEEEARTAREDDSADENPSV